MFIKFNEYELLELFLKEPILLHEKETGMYIYSQENTDGFSLTMFFSVYENVCDISLGHNKCAKQIFDLELKNVSCIKGDNEKLIITITGQQNNVVVYFKPNYALRFEKRED